MDENFEAWGSEVADMYAIAVLSAILHDAKGNVPKHVIEEHIDIAKDIFDKMKKRAPAIFLKKEGSGFLNHCHRLALKNPVLLGLWEHIKQVVDEVNGQKPS